MMRIICEPTKWSTLRITSSLFNLFLKIHFPLQHTLQQKLGDTLLTLSCFALQVGFKILEEHRFYIRFYKAKNNEWMNEYFEWNGWRVMIVEEVEILSHKERLLDTDD